MGSRYEKIDSGAQLKVYRVKNWDDFFENSKSRERDLLSWVPMPNKQHGIGVTLTLSQKNGGTLYGIWCLIVGALSQQRRPRAGWLTQDGHQAGTPWTLDDLSVKFRRPTEEIREALEWFSSIKMGWLETVDVEVSACGPPGACEVSVSSPRREEKGKEKKALKVLGAAPPTETEVLAYAAERKVPEPEARAFIDHHQTRGWKLRGGLAVKDWRAAFRTWEGNFRRGVFAGNGNKPLEINGIPLSMKHRRKHIWHRFELGKGLIEAWDTKAKTVTVYFFGLKREKEVKSEDLTWDEPQGMPELREKIAESLKNTGTT